MAKTEMRKRKGQQQEQVPTTTEIITIPDGQVRKKKSKSAIQERSAESQVPINQESMDDEPQTQFTVTSMDQLVEQYGGSYEKLVQSLKAQLADTTKVEVSNLLGEDEAGEDVYEEYAQTFDPLQEATDDDNNYTHDDPEQSMMDDEFDAESHDAESDSTDDEEMENIFQAAKTYFPTKKEIRQARVQGVACLKKDIVYFILSGVKSYQTFEDDDGNTITGDSLVVRVTNINEPNVKNRVTVRLSGVPYKQLVDEAEYERFHNEHHYFLIYEGKKTSKKGHEYNSVQVLHRKIGDKHWWINTRK